MIKQAAIELYQARKERDEAHEALKKYREGAGDCKRKYRGEYRENVSCFNWHPDQNEWCTVCLASQPLWERRKKASTRVGVALRKLMSLCAVEVRK